MEDNKKDVKILSDEELQMVTGGGIVNPLKGNANNSQAFCSKIKDENACKNASTFARCVWSNGKCVARGITY